MARAYMTKKQFIVMFTDTETYKNQMMLRKNRDRPMLREMWNNWIDSLIRDGQCKESAGNWLHIPTIA